MSCTETLLQKLNIASLFGLQILTFSPECAQKTRLTNLNWTTEISGSFFLYPESILFFLLLYVS